MKITVKRTLSLLLTLVLVLGVVPFGAFAAAPLRSNIKETLMPYFTRNATFYDANDARNNSFTMGGQAYSDSYTFSTGYNAGYNGDLYFNLNGEYRAMSFDVGYASGATVDSRVTVYVDGEIKMSLDMTPTALPEFVELDLSGAKQVRINVNSGAYDNTHYGVGNIQLTPVTQVVERPVLRSNTVWNCEAYQYKNGQFHAYKEDKSVNITGRTYTDAYTFKMGYNAGGKANVLFNLGKHYQSVSFDLGYVGGAVVNCNVIIKVDDETVETATVLQSDLAHTFTVDVAGARQLAVYMEYGGYDQTTYGIGNIQFTSDGNVYDVVVIPETLTLKKDNLTEMLEAHVYPIDADYPDVTWSSSDPSVAVVRENGEVQAFGSGTATITAMTMDGGYTDTCEVTVQMPDCPFTDVNKTDYYYNAINWAYWSHVAAGISTKSFAPMADCTRGQVVAFLWRAVGSPAPKSMNLPFTDVDTRQFYGKAIAWAYENGIVNGSSPTTFSPEGKVTREQFVTFLYRMEGSPSISAANTFSDVQPGMFYTNAVLWAAQNGITTGVGGGKFGVGQSCTRGQTMTFIYRYMMK